MDFFERLEDTVSAKGREIADKAKVLAEVTRLKNQISVCEDVIRKNCLEIGKLYCEEYGDSPDAPFEKQREAVRNAQKGIEELQAKIDVLKGL